MAACAHVNNADRAEAWLTNRWNPETAVGFALNAAQFHALLATAPGQQPRCARKGWLIFATSELTTQVKEEFV